MAAARNRNDDPYDNGGGFGKFRKLPFRKAHATPYDRPPTALRNPSATATANNTNGWLSRFVDPAHRLFTSGAYKLFGSVFRKRLPPPPAPHPSESEANVGASNSRQEAVLKESRGIQESEVNGIDYPSSSSDRGGLTELELMLKQKTFTKSEIDRLTALLQSKTIDLHVGSQEKNFEVAPSKRVLSQHIKEAPITPVQDNKLEHFDNSSPFTSSSVLGENVATPAELAKAYMGSRPSKVSPPLLGFHGCGIGEDSVVDASQPFPSKSPILSSVPRSSLHGMPIENGFVTPRSRGRSAIYNMARTPYSRLRPIPTLQGTGSEINVFAASSPSLSQSRWENGRFSGSKQGALKRSSSVFDNDIGSVGPIRRIRQKSNLLPPSGTLSIRGKGFVSDAGKRPSSYEKDALTKETVLENGDNMARASGTLSVPSKSSEMASQILQQLDVLVPSRDKSPSKLSPSMLRGQALRSLDNVESSKFLGTVKDDKQSDMRPSGSLSDRPEPSFHKEDKVEGNGTMNPPTSHDKSDSSLNGVDPANISKSNVKSTSPPGLSFISQSPPPKKRVFQMSAHEDFLELDDDDDHSDKTASVTRSTEEVKVGSAGVENKTSSVETSVSEKTAAVSEEQNKSISVCNQKALKSSDRVMVSDKDTTETVEAASLSGVSSQQTVVDNQAAVKSNNSAPTKEPNAAGPIFNFAKKASPEQTNGFPSAYNFSSKTSDAVSTSPTVTGPMGNMFGTSSFNKSDNSSSAGFNASNVMRPLSNEPEPNKADGKNSAKSAVVFGSTETPSSAISTSSPSISIFSFPTNPPATNGSIPTPSAFSADGAFASKTNSGQGPAGGSSNAITGINSTAPVFQFGSSASTMSISTAATVEPKKETTVSPFSSSIPPINSTVGSLFSSTSSSATKSTGSNIFDGKSAAASSNPFGMSSAAATSGSSGLFSFNAGANTSVVNPFSAANSQTSSAGPVFGTANQTTSVPFVSSASVPSLGLTGNTTFSSGTSFFGSSTSTDKFSSGATFGFTPSTSAANTVSSTTATPIFGTSFSSSAPSTGFVFGASSGSGPATSTAPVLFGSSANGSSGQAFKFNSPATPNPQSVFGSNPNSGFMFGSPPGGNNDQMNMEDSMAEDTVQAATTSAPVFGQPAATTTPSTGFVFGTSTPNAGTQFASPGVNPFQFSGQPAAPQQNPSPFQASGSLEFNAGGSFSLGTSDKSNRRIVKINRKQRKK